MKIPKHFLDKFAREFRTDLVQAVKAGYAFNAHWHQDDYTVHWAVEVLPREQSGFDPVWDDDRTYQAYAEDEDGPIGK